MAYFADCTAPLEQRRHDGHPFAPLPTNFLDLFPLKPRMLDCRQAAVLDLGKFGHFGRSPAIKILFGLRVKGGDMIGERVHQLCGEAAAPCERVKQQSLIEAAHHHDPVDRGIGRGEGDTLRWRAADATDLEIDCGRGAAVQSELCLASSLAALGSRKIEIRIFYGSFQLVDAIAREK